MKSIASICIEQPELCQMSVLFLTILTVLSHHVYLEDWFQFLDYLVNIKPICKCQLINVSVRHLKNFFATHTNHVIISVFTS